MGIQMGFYTISATMGKALYCNMNLYNVYIVHTNHFYKFVIFIGPSLPEAPQKCLVVN